MKRRTRDDKIAPGISEVGILERTRRDPQAHEGLG